MFKYNVYVSVSQFTVQIANPVGKASFWGSIFKVKMERNGSPASLNALTSSREVLRLCASASPGGLLKLEVAAPPPPPQFLFQRAWFRV